VLTLIDGKAFGATNSGLGGFVLNEVQVIATEGGSRDLLAPFVGQDGHNFNSPPSPVDFSFGEEPQ